MGFQKNIESLLLWVCDANRLKRPASESSWEIYSYDTAFDICNLKTLYERRSDRCVTLNIQFTVDYSHSTLTLKKSTIPKFGWEATGCLYFSLLAGHDKSARLLYRIFCYITNISIKRPRFPMSFKDSLQVHLFLSGYLFFSISTKKPLK